MCHSRIVSHKKNKKKNAHLNQLADFKIPKTHILKVNLNMLNLTHRCFVWSAVHPSPCIHTIHHQPPDCPALLCQKSPASNSLLYFSFNHRKGRKVSHCTFLLIRLHATLNVSRTILIKDFYLGWTFVLYFFLFCGKVGWFF